MGISRLYQNDDCAVSVGRAGRSVGVDPVRVEDCALLGANKSR